MSNSQATERIPRFREAEIDAFAHSIDELDRATNGGPTLAAPKVGIAPPGAGEAGSPGAGGVPTDQAADTSAPPSVATGEPHAIWSGTGGGR